MLKIIGLHVILPLSNHCNKSPYEKAIWNKDNTFV